MKSKQGIVPLQSEARHISIKWEHYLGIFLLSLATLLLELALTRVLSVSNWYHFGFLVISTALLGFGSSGVVLSLWRKLRQEFQLEAALATLSTAFGLVTVASFWAMQRISFDPFSLLLDRRQLLVTPLYYLALAAPFFFSGLAIALLFTRGSEVVNRLYAADLLGAGLGCAAVAVVMPTFGGSGSVVLAAAVGLLAAVVFGFSQTRRLASTAAVLAAATFTLAFVAEQKLPIAVTPSKHHPLLPAGQKPIYTAWNTFSRVDVYKLSALPEAGRPDPGFSIIIDAGAAGTAMADLSRGARNYLADSPGYQPAGLVYVGKQHPKVLIIGSGAGREVLEALHFGASSITAVEINPIINNIVTSRMRNYWGGLFEQPEVRLVTEDGRSFVRRSKEKYDAIISIQTMSDAAMASGALTLSESYVLTTEAFADYFDHLTADGSLLITRPEYQIPKLFATARELFGQRGLGSPADHLFAFRGPTMPFGHRQFLTGIIFKKSPLTSGEIQTLTERLGVGKAYVGPESKPPEIFYAPSRPPRGSFQQLLLNLTTSPDLTKIYASSWQLLSPATDDRPFFNQRMRWSSLRPFVFREVLASRGNNVNGLPVAEITLLILLLQAVLIAGALILFPLFRFSKQGLRTPGRWSFLTYFAGLGLGFIMIEIVLLQRFTLFLGEPIYTFAVVLASLLIFTGLGSLTAFRFRQNSRRTICWIILAIIAALAVTLVIMPKVLAGALGLALFWRVLLTIAIVAPIGFLLGMPFPTGLRIVAHKAPPLVPWAWAVNGFFTVIGSVGTVILGMALGFTSVFACAGLCYGIAGAAMLIGSRPVSVAYPEQKLAVGSQVA